MPHFLLKALLEVDKHWYTKTFMLHFECMIQGFFWHIGSDFVILGSRIWAHKNLSINFSLLCSKINFPMYYEKSIFRPCFSDQNSKLISKGSEKTKKDEKYGLAKPCSLLTIVCLSDGATVFSRIYFHWSDNILKQDTEKSSVAY